MIKKTSRIFLAGHNGLIGSAVLRLLRKNGYKKIFTESRKKLDLRNYKKVENFFKKKKIEYVIIAAAKVGGILENSKYPTEFLTENLAIHNNILLLCKKYKVKRTIFLGSSCIYPKLSKIPIKEKYLLTGTLEKTNEAYAISKIAGIILCQSLFYQYKQDIVCLMPTNAYGKNDNFDAFSSHVIPGMITKFLYAKNKNKNVTLWGSGKPIREFIYDEDLANAILKILVTPQKKILKICNNELPLFNVGSGESLSIKKLSYLIKKIMKFKRKIIFDKNFFDGTMIKNLDSSKIRKIGWKPKVFLKEGLTKIIENIRD